MLQGVRIVEVEGLGPGPFTGMLLADLGAEVIVVHRKGGAATPGMPEQSILDRGKRSIELNLKDPADIEIFMALVASADGLIEGFRPGVMEKLGIGPKACHARNPGLVFGRMTGWGQEGPLSTAAGHDLNYISMAGAAWYASDAGDAPFTPPTLVGDIGGGSMYLAVGILAGIMRARATGQGTVVDAAIYDGSAHMMNLMMTMRQTGNFGVTRGANLLDGPHWSRSYSTSDGGFMSVQCLEPKFYAIFLDLMGLAEDEAFRAQYDKRSWPALTERLAAMFAEKPRAHWETLFLGTDACVAPVLNPEEAAAHEMNLARKTWHENDGVLQAAPAPRFLGTAEWTPPPIPMRGDHTKEILAELGMDEGDAA
ncbi:CaiB/BaiF CoA-transferase family protein [Alisedimentitalea sp. MJ-SS2]|uniref:CaiB/BaiF CoA transferase family protein n=1 Tax=Aliisedimentitalea sp. MJ-SS2 TaxID=3049795 RepID=UPI00291005AA|nr:CaiB/BaiF CoA-transferase family protein [Alisedimentitalea sp. MJ-SS2]MDU8929821.1 CaiB/BaiF CoA-transferase family protein [Alisedimentitalea sp. MJ-SS2]